MSKAGGLVKGFASSIGGLAGLAAPLAGALTGVVAAVKGIAEVGQAFGEIDEIAKSAQKFGVTTEQMVGLQHAAELSGVSVEQLDSAMKKAARNGTSLEAIADKIAATSDPTERANIAFKALGKSGQDMIPLLSGGSEALRQMMDEGNRLAGFSGVDAAKVEAANDAITRMKLAFTGIARDLAIELAPAVEMIAVGVQKVGEWGRAAFTDVKNFAIDAFLVAEFGWNHMGEIAALAWDAIKLGAIGFWEDTKFMFTDQIPAVITWFADNFTNIIFTAVDYALTVFINLGTNIRALWQGVLDFIAGNGFNVDWTPLTEGAVSAISKMPDIPERALTQVEQDLAKGIASRSSSLMDGLGQHMLDSRPAPGGPAATPTTGGLPGGGPADLKDLKGPAAAQRGSADAFSSIFSAMRGGGGDPQQETAKNTKQTADDVRQLVRETRKQNKAEVVQLVAGPV